MRHVAFYLFAIFMAFLVTPSRLHGQVGEVLGRATITDGDTVIVGDTKIRLQGIDAPETDQICLDANGQDWTCGIAARDALLVRAGQSNWRCLLAGRDTYGRALGTCMVDGVDINRWMVAQGWAMAFIRYSRAYVPDESEAKQARKGLWAGAFLAPWDWRRRNCETEMHSVMPISIEAHRRLCGAPAIPPSPDCQIKGNLKRDGCTYHLPGGRHYGRLSMDGTKRRWFCTEAEAQAAGCRRAKN